MCVQLAGEAERPLSTRAAARRLSSQHERTPLRQDLSISGEAGRAWRAQRAMLRRCGSTHGRNDQALRGGAARRSARRRLQARACATVRRLVPVGLTGTRTAGVPSDSVTVASPVAGELAWAAVVAAAAAFAFARDACAFTHLLALSSCGVVQECRGERVALSSA